MNGGDPLEAWAQHQGRASGAGRARERRPRAARRARDVPRAPGDRHACPTASRSRSRRRRTSTAGRSPACGRRGRSRAKPTRAYYYLTDVDPVVAARAAGRAPARLQLPDALVDLDSRGLPGPLPALPAPAPRRVEGAQVDHVRPGVVRRRLGALLRADDDRGRASAVRIRGVKLGQLAEALIRLVAVHRRHQAARRGHVGRAGRAVLPRRGVHGRGERAARGRARHVRSDLSRLHASAS